MFVADVATENKENLRKLPDKFEATSKGLKSDFSTPGNTVRTIKDNKEEALFENCYLKAVSTSTWGINSVIRNETLQFGHAKIIVG